MDKAKILRMLDEADDIVNALYRQGANKDYKCKSIREKLKAISAEISAKPVTNGDRIRQMSDEELADFINDVTDCCSDGYICEKCPLDSVGKHCNIFTVEKWLERECEENDET